MKTVRNIAGLLAMIPFLISATGVGIHSHICKNLETEYTGFFSHQSCCNTTDDELLSCCQNEGSKPDNTCTIKEEVCCSGDYHYLKLDDEYQVQREENKIPVIRISDQHQISIILQCPLSCGQDFFVSKSPRMH